MPQKNRHGETMNSRYSKVSNALAETIVGNTRFDSAEVAERADVDRDDARRFWQALGFPTPSSGERIFTEQDVAMLRAGRDVLDREDADEQVLLQIARVSGQALARMSAVQVVPIAQLILTAMRSKELSDSEAVDHVVDAAMPC